MTTFVLSIALSVPDLQLDKVACETFDGSEAISELFRFEASFVSSRDLSGASIAGKPAWITVTLSTRTGVFAGVVMEFRVKDRVRADGDYAYALVIGPRLQLLDYSKQTEVFATDTALGYRELLTGVLAGTLSKDSTTGGHGQTLRYTVSDTLDQSFQRSNITKYNETDFEFFSRTAEYFGVFYFFTSAAGSGDGYDDTLTLGAKNTDFVAGPTITYNPQRMTFDPASAAVVSLSRVERPQIKGFKLRDYNAAQPGADLLASSRSANDAGVATMVEHGEYYPDQNEGATLATMRAEELAWQADVFEGVSTAPQLRAGMTFDLTDHPIGDFNRKYVVVSVRHAAAVLNPAGFSGETNAAAGYRNSFVAIAYSRNFRPKRRTPRPVMAGVFNAVVDASGTPTRAVLEPDGSYRVTYRYNEGASRQDAQAGKRSSPLRQVQPYASSSTSNVASGLHLPLVKNTEVLVGYVNGDPDRPIIMGAAYNGANPDIVTATSQSVNRLRTTAGTLLELEDGASSDKPRYLRMDVPKDAGGSVPSGTYLRLGASSGSDETNAHAKSGLTYTTSTTDYKEYGAYGANQGGFSNSSSGKGSSSESSAKVQTSDPVETSGNGVLIYTEDDLDVNVVGTGTLKFGKGQTTETDNGDSTHTVPNGQYSLSANTGVSITAGTSSNPADINLHATNAIKQTADGPVSMFTYGTMTKYTVGESFTMFFGLEQTLKASVSITIQLAGVVTMTIGVNSSVTVGVKADMIVGQSAKLIPVGGDVKLTMADLKITQTDMKLANSDFKVCSIIDGKFVELAWEYIALKFSKVDANTKEAGIGLDYCDLAMSRYTSKCNFVTLENYV